jgi:hypothetical protein
MTSSVYRLTGAMVTQRCALLAAVLTAGSDACGSHGSAAAIYDIPGFGFGLPEVTSPRAFRRELGVGRVHHSRELPPGHVRVVDEIRVTSIARTLFDLAAVVHPGRVERALDTCLARRTVSVPACWRVVDDLARRGRGGTTLLRGLLSARGEGYVAPASELESRLLTVLVDGGLPVPAREVDLGDPDGWVGRVEFVYRSERVLVEADSRLHHTTLVDREHDRRRDERFAAEGFQVVRVGWAEVTKHPERVVRQVRDALRTAA